MTINTLLIIRRLKNVECRKDWQVLHFLYNRCHYSFITGNNSYIDLGLATLAGFVWQMVE